MTKAVFLDRDGTLIEEVNYLSNIDDLKIFRYSFDAVKILNKLNFKVIVITNQSGIGRKYFNKEFVERTHNLISEIFLKNNAVIHDFYYCPHLPDDNCECRKPKTGMVNKAVEKYGIDVSKSFFIGDSAKDVETGLNSGIFPIQVLTGHGRKERDKSSVITLNIYTAALLIKNFS
jgi:D-glycero-D-manno-heptose 1,7-bisphosphate phosphatase